MFPGGGAYLGGGGLYGSRRRHNGLLGTAAGEDVGLKELPDRESVREVLQGGHEAYESDEGAQAVLGRDCHL